MSNTNQLHIDIQLSINKYEFNQDFLDIEVEKKFSIYGDDLVQRMKEPYREDARNYGNLFSNKYIYDCRGIVDNKVLLIGHKVYWK